MSVQKYLEFGQKEDNQIIQTWISKESNKRYFGELDSDSKATGRGICIDSQEYIWFGFFKDGSLANGHFICIVNDGKFKVGERCENEFGQTRRRGTLYNIDGTSSIFGYDALSKNLSEESKESTKDFLTAIIECMSASQIPEAEEIKQAISTV